MAMLDEEMGAGKIGKSFKHVCKLLFGSEIGELKDFGPYFKEMMYTYRDASSCLSGKPTMVSSPHYMESARYISQEEISQLRSEPLDINRIKDMDSLLDAVGERVLYCGNKLFGKNEGVHAVDNGFDCTNVHSSHNTYSVKDSAFLSLGVEDAGIFGCSGMMHSYYCMRCIRCINDAGAGATRCFESHYGVNLSDSYYAFNCRGSSNLMFCFNQTGKSYMVGNLQLTKERYMEIRSILLSELAEKLGRDKRAPSFTDLLGAKKGGFERERASLFSNPPPQIEKAFSDTTNVVLGKRHKNSRDYSGWLLSKVIGVKLVKGAFGSPTYSVDLPMLRDLPASRLATLDEARSNSGNSIELLPNEGISFDTIAAKAAKIALFTNEFIDGHCMGNVDVPSQQNSTNLYRVWNGIASTLSAYGTIVNRSKYVFGGYMRAYLCEFCINCYNSSNLKRCFECDSTYNSSDCYFTHNCEEMSECILCFNAKGLKYAVGNTELPKEEYIRIKEILLAYINSQLEQKKKLDLSIFDLKSK
ncbi:MAG: hypothetical protein PHS02_01225 [Candidatus ainarchaeum sp.]|nr:hypothetical protein [Candidatus ainarchaeum sp.]